MGDFLKYLEGNYSTSDFSIAIKESIEDLKQAMELASAEEDMKISMQNLKDMREKNHYLVDGAILTCTCCTLEPKTPINKEFTAPEGSDEVVLKVTHNSTYVNGAGQCFATVRDSKVTYNIEPFGNCLNPPDREKEKEALKLAEHSEEIRKLGTCRLLMELNDTWENIISDTGYEELSEFGSKPLETITMESILFCKHGGFIYPISSGYIPTDNVMEKNIWKDYEIELLSKFGNQLEFDNWSDEKKKCAQEIWNRFYVNGEYDAYFVAGLIGNMYGEANVGMLQQIDWSNYSDSNGNVLEGGSIINNINQAIVACTVAPDNYGIGMMQWSDMDRKNLLLTNYQLYQSSDGSLSMEQMINAECKTIMDELNGNYKKVHEKYQEKVQYIDDEGDMITLSTNVICRVYLVPSGYKKIDNQTYTVAEEVWDKIKDAERLEDVSTFCKRDVAAKIAYEEFMEINEN